MPIRVQPMVAVGVVMSLLSAACGESSSGSGQSGPQSATANADIPASPAGAMSPNGVAQNTMSGAQATATPSAGQSQMNGSGTSMPAAGEGGATAGAPSGSPLGGVAGAGGGLPAGSGAGAAGGSQDAIPTDSSEMAGTNGGMGAAAAGQDAGNPVMTPADGSTGAPSADASPSSGCGSTTGPGDDTYSINVAGSERTYILRVPDDYDANHPYRLILSYHPLGGTAEFVAFGSYYGLLAMAGDSTVFAAPQGIDNGWSDPGRSFTSGGEDIQFTQAIIDDLTSKLCIDESRIFAEGFSMGGSMAYAIACALGDVVRGVVAHSGGPMSGCVTHDTPVAYFMTHGTEDSVCTYPAFGVPQVNDFAAVNGCMPKDMPTPSGTDPACIDFDGCMPGYPTRACIFVGDHTPSPAGNWVPGESWAFISQF